MLVPWNVDALKRGFHEHSMTDGASLYWTSVILRRALAKTTLGVSHGCIQDWNCDQNHPTIFFRSWQAALQTHVKNHYQSTSPTSGPRNRVLQTTQNGWSPPPCHATRPLKDSPRPRARDRSAARLGTRRCCKWKDRPNPGTTGSGMWILIPAAKGHKTSSCESWRNKKQKTTLMNIRIEKSG